MNNQNWNQAKEIFYSALNLPTEEREQFLIHSCKDDKELLSDIRNLLNSYNEDFLEQPILDLQNDSYTQNNSTDSRFKNGDQINHYLIIRSLGRGGMGEVFLAKDSKLDRFVAIKILHKGAGEVAEKRLLREARSVAKLDHPNICSIYEVGETEEFPYIVMQYIEGKTLDKLIRAKNLSAQSSIEIIRQIAEALNEAHANKIIHRDIKPANIIIDLKKNVKVLDFSLAKTIFIESGANTESMLSELGVVAGTVAYMSPEQARGQEIDTRSDIWSLGVVFYEMLTGQLPFSGESKSDIIASILTKEPIKINEIAGEFPIEFDEILTKVLQKNRVERYATINDFLAELARLNELEQDFSQITPKLQQNRSNQETIQANLVSNDSEQNSTYSNINNITKETKQSFFEPKPQFSLGWKWLVPSFVILGVIFGGFYWEFYSKDQSKISAKPGSFSADSREKLKLSSLFSAKRSKNSNLNSLEFSPDGKLISFVLRTINSNDIYIKQVDQSEPKKITDGKGFYQTPIWSPDGHKLAFVSTIDGKTGIWTIPFLGGVPKLETGLELSYENYQLKKWSNDGKRIFFSDNKGKLSSIELETGKIEEIILPGNEAKREFNISRDEKYVTFATTNNSIRQISIYSFETQKLTTLSGENKFYYPYFFPDNNKIAFSSDQNGDNQIYVSDLVNSKPVQITFGDTNVVDPIVSPDGKKILYLTTIDESNIFSLDTESKIETQITNNTNLQLIPTVSTDNSKIAYTATKTLETFNLSPLKVKSLGGENQTIQIAEKGLLPVWSSKNDSIFFTKIDGLKRQIWKADIASQKETQLTDDVKLENYFFIPFYFSTSPFNLSADGTKLVYNSARTGFENIWTVDENGENSQMLTDNKDSNTKFSSPLYSPKGEQIAFLSSSKIENNQTQYTVLILANGQTQTVFQNNSPIKLLGWSNTGEDLYIAVDKKDSVESLQFSIFKNSQPKSILSAADANINSFALSPNKNAIAFSALQNEIDDLYLFQIGGAKTQISRNSDKYTYFSGLSWANDNKTIYYSKQSGGDQIQMISDPN